VVVTVTAMTVTTLPIPKSIILPPAYIPLCTTHPLPHYFPLSKWMKTSILDKCLGQVWENNRNVQVLGTRWEHVACEKYYQQSRLHINGEEIPWYVLAYLQPEFSDRSCLIHLRSLFALARRVSRPLPYKSINNCLFDHCWPQAAIPGLHSQIFDLSLSR